jgi:(S)-2-hydroxyglutarate dehydrogenase
MDFLVLAKDGSVHVMNPVSPAFTSSMELARQIAAEHFQ